MMLSSRTAYRRLPESLSAARRTVDTPKEPFFAGYRRQATGYSKSARQSAGNVHPPLSVLIARSL
jgi:hypothetical protein